MTLLTFENNTPAPSMKEAGVRRTTRCDELPRLTSTVPREYVHRSSVAEVFLTGYERIGDDTFLLTGQWPRAHTFFISADGTGHDLVQVGETVRQAGLLLCHAEYGVPLGHNVLLWSLGFKADLEQLLIGVGPTDLELIATCRDFGWKGNRFSGFLEVSVRREGRIAATGSGFFSFVPPAVYRRLRGEYGRLSTAAPAQLPPRPAPILPAEAGRLLPFDVVLAPGDRPGRWLLSPDLTHPILFEHANDHHPGMVLVEAARQAACGTLHARSFRPTAVESSFHNYAELDAPCWIDTEVPHSMNPGIRTVHVTGHQGDARIFEATVTGTIASD
ncbi:ScbA/BarX family gamma-butyrolactone biosynthesis protein [Streptomyces sp. WM4235]|uniref:ScbA/BarX family gamma-butyrolactone biosynthesis protein n=1 Tax=Streptomyces sp. WM4235 TaxID=1415551 RepID=UPI00099C505B|nr:ScbA/BarX family gamma-butyrolactone biosynthesis protein [Streptomyces sp. WM4235]